MTEVTEKWASAVAATITEPSVGQQAAGFTCGPADPGVFNWLFRTVTENLIDLNDAKGGNIPDLNTATTTGVFVMFVNAVGNPVFGRSGAVLHVEGNNNEAWQLVLSDNGRTLTRVRTGVATWTAWRELLDTVGDQTIAADVTASHFKTSGIGSFTNPLFEFPGNVGIYRLSDVDGKAIAFTEDNVRTLEVGQGAFRYMTNDIWHDGNSDELLSTAAGYQKLPSGIIMQWGQASSASITTRTFPIAFPNSTSPNILCTSSHGAPGRVAAFNVNTTSKTGFTINQFSVEGGTTAWRWMAIGF